MEEKNASKIEATLNRISKTAEDDLGDEIARDDRLASIVIIVICSSIGLYLITHQILSTGFFTASFGAFEILLLYGTLIYWITTCALILIGCKNPSRDLDSFGGLFFATFSILWLLVVFPFEYTYYANVLPDFLRFLLQWNSNDIARVLFVLGIIIHLTFAVYSFILRVFVYKARAIKSANKDINEDKNTISE